MTNVMDKLTQFERQQFDDALASMLAHIDQGPALSTKLCLLRCLPASDCMVEIRATRYLTPVEWEGVAKHLEVLRATQARAAPRQPTDKKKRERP